MKRIDCLQSSLLKKRLGGGRVFNFPRNRHLVYRCCQPSGSFRGGELKTALQTALQSANPLPETIVQIAQQHWYGHLCLEKKAVQYSPAETHQNLTLCLSLGRKEFAEGHLSFLSGLAGSGHKFQMSGCMGWSVVVPKCFTHRRRNTFNKEQLGRPELRGFKMTDLQ